MTFVSLTFIFIIFLSSSLQICKIIFACGTNHISPTKAYSDTPTDFSLSNPMYIFLAFSPILLLRHPWLLETNKLDTPLCLKLSFILNFLDCVLSSLYIPCINLLLLWLEVAQCYFFVCGTLLDTFSKCKKATYLYCPSFVFFRSCAFSITCSTINM